MSIEALRAKRTRLIDYLRLKVDEGDWHGVADAAMDLRELEARLDLLAHLATKDIAIVEVTEG